MSFNIKTNCFKYHKLGTSYSYNKHENTKKKEKVVYFVLQTESLY